MPKYMNLGLKIITGVTITGALIFAPAQAEASNNDWVRSRMKHTEWNWNMKSDFHDLSKKMDTYESMHREDVAKYFASSSEMFDTSSWKVKGMNQGHHSKASKRGTIVDVAVANPELSTLVTAVTEAGLVDTLSTGGPFTVFAPTNAAFDKLPEGTLAAVLADKDLLTSILKYHVVEGKVKAKDVVKLTSATTLQGGDVVIDATDGVKINDATVIQTDIKASNGIVHMIDTVLLPN